MKSVLVASILALPVVNCLHAAPPPAPGPGAQALFDGRSLRGWEGATNLWKAADGTIVGGSTNLTLPQNEFLATNRRYTNFVLRLQFRLRGGAGFINSGVQIRSERVPDNSEMAGYQCDLGDPEWWGSLYDESRRNRVLAWSDVQSINRVLRRNDWNDYVILADGPRIATWINGVAGVDYYEPDPAIAGQGGRIGFQVHGGGAPEASFRNVTVEELPPSNPAVGARPPTPPPHPSPLTPDEQLQTFSLPPGFVAELVAAEPDGGKFVPIAFDAAGRLWTATALDYPIDANESPAEARALFARGGRDRILVFDTPGAPGRQTPRVFAEGLAMPLGVLPYRDGAIAQYGSEIRFYRDTDGDGRADRHEAILTGFGIEDSHLFPHQFTRLPGNWILLAQGAFNSSQVRSPDGAVTPFNRTKLARFRPDGTRFQTVGWGPCNIWGLVLDRQGELFIQEANDQGWPLMPFLEGASYPLCGDDVPKPYAPPFPKTGEREMGGTGLSGLALSEGANSFPKPWRDVFFVANPITRKIQAIRLHRGASNPAPDAYGNGWQLEHLPDFVLSSDPWFRPVASAFGPDGCLYLIDWYNHVISHNEVPRNHPDRDKSRGRIWRIRHRDQPHRPTVPDLARADEAGLLAALRSNSGWDAQHAWQQIGDRNLTTLAPTLESILTDASQPADLRIRALWALEGVGRLDASILEGTFHAAGSRSLRREILRAAGSNLGASELRSIAGLGLGDPDRLVRQESIRCLVQLLDQVAARPAPTPAEATAADAAVQLLLHAGATAPAGDWPRAPLFFQAFERYLVRSALERHPARVSRFLQSPPPSTLPEAVAIAALVVKTPDAARRFARQVPSLRRGATTEELLLLASIADDAEARAPLQAALALPETLRLLADNADRLGEAGALRPLVAEAVRQRFTAQPGDDTTDLLLRLAAAFRLAQLEPEVTRIVSAPTLPTARRLAAVRALRQVAPDRVDLLATLAATGDGPIRNEALAAIAGSKAESALPTLLELWPSLSAPQRRSLVDRLASKPDSARRLLAAIQSKAIPREDLDGYTLDKLSAILPNDPDVARMVEEIGGLLRPVLRLNGADTARVEEPIQIDGPFTVEAWVRLEPDVSNADSLLGGPGMDINFFQSTLRVWIGAPHHDIVVASRPAMPEAWTHFAITRDARGLYRIHVNGEPDRTSTAAEPKPLRDLRIGASTAGGGTAADFVEFRIWNHARSTDQIRANANLALAPGTPGLVFHGHGKDWGRLGNGARVERTADLPPILGEAEAGHLRERFEQVRGLASRPGNVAKGRTAFTGLCAPCHAVQGNGGRIGPALDGAGAQGLEPLLRHVLTPNAAMEAGYRRFRIETRDGEVHEGLLVTADASRIVLRQPSSPDQEFPRTDVRQSGFLRGSLMPEGLLDSARPDEVTDLFAYLLTLGAGRDR